MVKDLLHLLGEFDVFVDRFYRAIVRGDRRLFTRLTQYFTFLFFQDLTKVSGGKDMMWQEKKFFVVLLFLCQKTQHTDIKVKVLFVSSYVFISPVCGENVGQGTYKNLLL